MSTQTILADQTVSITEFRKKPQEFFTDRPIAVLSNNRAAGYVLGAEVFEQLVAIVRQSNQSEVFNGQFLPTADRLRQIASRGAELLENATDGQLENFSE